MRPFTTEAELTDVALSSEAFLEAVGYTDWAMWQAREPLGLFGIPDVVFGFIKTTIKGNPIIRTCAFEMKLDNWKRALVQAYKYAAFVHYPFVVMDHKYVGRAKRNITLFHKSNIGLMSINPFGEVFVHSRPQYRKPYCSSLEEILGKRIVQDLSLG